MPVVSAFLVPGMPQPCLRPEVPGWGRLAAAMQRAPGAAFAFSDSCAIDQDGVVLWPDHKAYYGPAVLAEDADALGCQRELQGARAILASGTSADRQLAAFAEARAQGLDEPEALGAVVDWLAKTTAGG